VTEKTLTAEKFLTIEQVAERVKLNRATLWRLWHQGNFPPPARREWRRDYWIESEIVAWVAKR